MKRQVISFEPEVKDFSPFGLDVPNTADYTDETENIRQIVNDFLNSSDLLNIFKDYLNTPDFEKDFDEIIDQRIEFDRKYIQLDDEKVQTVLERPSLALDTFNEYEIKVLINQAKFFELIDDETYQALLDDYTKFTHLVQPDQIIFLMNKQVSFVSRIPNMSDLEDNGLLDSIIKVIQQNPNLLIDESLVQRITEETVNRVLQDAQFTLFTQAQNILHNPADIKLILNDNELERLLRLVQPYLSFMTNSKIESALQLDENESILSIFDENEIRHIIDKELDLKYQLMKTLTPAEIEARFNELKEQFLNTDFSELVQVYITNILRSEELTDERVLLWIREAKDEVRLENGEL